MLKVKRDENFLAHYGILGMRWGVRRYQNEDGTLTAAGKIRYQDLWKDVKKRTEMSDAQEHKKHLSAKSDELLSNANDLGKEYGKYFESLKGDPELKKAYAKRLKDTYEGDEDFSDDAADDVIKDYVSKNKDLKAKRDSLQAGIDEYFKDSEAKVNSIVAEYANVKIKGALHWDRKDAKKNIQFDGQKEVERLLYDNLEDGTPSYLNRHFEDYWVYDTKAYYNLVESITGVHRYWFDDPD